MEEITASIGESTDDDDDTECLIQDVLPWEGQGEREKLKMV